MSLVNITLPIGAFDRLIRQLERIANALERQFPSLLTDEDLKLSEPTSGLTIVTNEVLLEEEVRQELRLKGFMPDDIEAMIRENENGENQTTTG